MSRYRIEALLGEGGMASVYRATDPEIGRPVAIKVLKPTFDTNYKARQRFLREAKAGARLAHPNVVKLYDAGEEEGRLYLAMELVRGDSLARHLDTRTLPLRTLLEILEGAARGVHHAHRHGIVHRDLKPGNILVSERNEAKVADFGLAHLIESESTLTQSGAVLGTPLFMSPEQARAAKEVTPRSDVYSLGAILYLTLTDRMPYEGDTTAAVIGKILAADLTPPRTIRPAVAADLETICLKAMDPVPARRYETAEAFADDLRRHLDGRPIRTRPPGLGSRIVRRIRRHPALAAAGGALLVAAVAASAILISQRIDSARRLEASQKLASHWSTITERKRELRSGRIQPGQAKVDLAKAVADVDRFIAEQPNAPQGYYVRARGRIYLGDLDGALSDIQTVLTRTPEFRPAWTLLGYVRVEQCLDLLYSKDHEPPTREAVEAFVRGGGAEGDRAEWDRWNLPWTREDEVMSRLAVALQMTYGEKRRADASRLLTEEVRRYRAEEYALFLALWTEALADEARILEEAVEWAPGYEWARFARARVRTRRGDTAGAIADYDRAIDVRGDFAIAYANRGAVKAGAGDTQGALADYDKAIQAKPNLYQAYVNRGHSRAHLGNLEGALADYDRAIDLQPNLAVVWLSRANFHKNRSEHAKALADYDRVIERAPEHAEALMLRGTMKDALGDAKGALADLGRAVEIRPDYAEAHYNRGNVLMRVPDMPAAAAAYDRCLAIRPDSVDALANRGAARIGLGDLAGAKADLARALELQPNHRGALVNRANVRLSEEDYRGALADCERALAIDADDVQALLNRGIAREGLGDDRGAIADYTRAIAGRKDYALAWCNRGRLAMKNGEFQAALADFDQAIGLQPGYCGALVNRGSLKIHLRDFAGAVADLERCLAAAPADWPQQDLARTLLAEARKKVPR